MSCKRSSLICQRRRNKAECHCYQVGFLVKVFCHESLLEFRHGDADFDVVASVTAVTFGRKIAGLVILLVMML
jgi:hypothetical protein